MATVKKRGNKYAVIYDYRDAKGQRHQKWETFASKEEAEKFKKKIEYKKSCNTFLTPSDQTVADFLMSWANIYGKSKWSFSMCTSSLALIRNHIIPEIGQIPLQKLQPIHIELLYSTLRTKKCSGAKGNAARAEDIPVLSSTTIRHVHTLLKTAFDKAVDWKMIESNPVVCDAPKKNKTERHIWTPEMVRQALDDIKHPMLHLAVHLAFICSLRIGETVGLTWEDIDFDHNLIHVRRTLQRVSKEALELVPKDGLTQVFPSKIAGTNSVLVLKPPKTAKSSRIVYLTPALRRELMIQKAAVAKQKAFAGDEYLDFNLVFSLEDGSPVEPKLCEKWFKKWQKRTELNLPPLIFHEIRHSSATYKLLESGGDVKLVQGDMGHASATVSLDTYAHTQDNRRRALTEKISKEFYGGSSADDRQDQLMQILDEDPEMKKKLLEALLAENAQKNNVGNSVSRYQTAV